MTAPRDPVSDVLACLLAIIEGLCRALAEQAAREETPAGQALALRLLSGRLHRAREQIAAAVQPRPTAAARRAPRHGALCHRSLRHGAGAPRPRPATAPALAPRRPAAARPPSVAARPSRFSASGAPGLRTP